jgi:hypothetical protein
MSFFYWGVKDVIELPENLEKKNPDWIIDFINEFHEDDLSYFSRYNIPHG